MAKTGGAVAKLQLKAKQRAVKFRKGSSQSILARVSESYQGGKAGRAVAWEEHKLRLNGIMGADGEWIRKPIPVVAAETFHGDGLPNEGYDIGDDGKFVGLKEPKTNAERAAKDKRAGLATEWKDGFRPRSLAERRKRSHLYG